MKIGQSIKTKIGIILLVGFIIPFVFQLFQVNFLTKNLVQDKIFKTTYKTFENSVLLISSVIQSQHDMAWYYKKDPLIKEVAANFENLDHKQLSDLRGQIRNRIINENNFDRFSYPFNYIILDYQGNLMTNYTYSPYADYKRVYEKLSSKEWFQTIKNSYVDFSVMFSDEDYFSQAGTPKLYVATNIFGDGNQGILLIAVDQGSISAQFSNVLGGSSYIASGSGDLLATSEDSQMPYQRQMYEEVTGNPDFDSEDVVISTLASSGPSKYIFMEKDMFIKGSHASFKVLSVVPFDNVVSDLERINITNLVVLGFYFLAIVLVIVWLNKDIARPIIKLADSVSEVADGNLSVKAENLPHNEIGVLGDGFNVMVKEIERYIREMQEREELKRETDLRLLQNQIKPHFVQNVLNTIRWLAEINGVPSVSKSIMSLSSLLEYNFRDTKMLSTVADEVYYVQKYIYLQKLRFQNKFKDEYDVDENIMHLPILKLSFQPIVENCIYHGLLGRDGLGIIKIKGERTIDCLKFVISDDGVGIPEEELEKILKLPGKDEIVEATKNLENIALWNINLRIKKQFGDEFGIQVESVLGEGTKVTVLFPVQEGVPDVD